MEQGGCALTACPVAKQEEDWNLQSNVLFITGICSQGSKEWLTEAHSSAKVSYSQISTKAFMVAVFDRLRIYYSCEYRFQRFIICKFYLQSWSISTVECVNSL